MGIVASLLAGATRKADVASLHIGFLACIAFSAGALVLAGWLRAASRASTPAG